MQTALAEMCRAESYSDDAACECAGDVQASSDRISLRGLEILRILNDVFNGLPLETAGRMNDPLAVRG